MTQSCCELGPTLRLSQPEHCSVQSGLWSRMAWGERMTNATAAEGGHKLLPEAIIKGLQGVVVARPYSVLQGPMNNCFKPEHRDPRPELGGPISGREGR